MFFFMIKTNKRITILFVVLATIFSLFFYFNSKNFQAKFFNKTGRNIDSLQIGNNFVGQLKKDSSTGFIYFRKFEFDSEFPYEDVSGKINGQKLNPFYWSPCGTERNYLSNGTYQFDIRLGINLKGETVLFLALHNKKMFWE